MTSIVRWYPLRDMDHLGRAVDRMFDDLRHRPLLARWEGDATFPMDISETDDALVVKAALPGIKPEQVDISVTGDILTVRGATGAQEEVEGESYHRRELRHGAFARSIALPTRVDHDRAEAVFDNGVLTITLPKAEEARPKSIKVRTVVQPR